MKLNLALLSKLQDATRQLLANGPMGATAAIQQALGGLPPATPQPKPEPEPQQPPQPQAMRDLNPAPQATLSRRTGHSADAGTIDTVDTAEPARHSADAGPAPAAAHAASATSQRQAQGTQDTHSPHPHADDTPQATATPGAGNLPGAPAFVNDLLAKLGALSPDGKLPNMPNMDLSKLDLSKLDLSNIDLSSLNLPNIDLPGMRKPRPVRPLPPGAQFIDGEYRGETGARHYKLYIPASYRGQPLPLVVMLHGCTQDPDDFAAGTRMNELAEEKQCLIVYPAQSQQANQQRCWNWFNALDQQRGQGEPAIIAGIARQVAAQYAVKPRQVYVAGLSAGGAMAVIVGTLYPDVFAAVGVHSGLPYASAQDLPSALQAMKQGAAAKRTHDAKGSNDAGRPIIVFHGDRDHTVHPRNGEQVMAQQLHRHRNAQAHSDGGSVPDGHRYTRTTHRHADGTPLGEHWVVHGAGHAWSGGSADGSYTDARGPDASREMLRFFDTVSA